MIAAWSMLRGRSRHDSLCACDGFRGEHPYASVAVVAEGTGGDARSAETAVATVRDVFAEGVAFRIGEALAEAFHEAGEKIRAEELRGCSATAVAVLGRDAWIVHAGGCRAFLTGPGGVRTLTSEHTLAGEMGLSPGDPGYRQRVGDLTLQLGQKDLRPQTLSLSLADGEGVLLATGAVWRHIQTSRLFSLLSAQGGLQQGVESVLRESRVRFRRQGGAAAAIFPETQQGFLGGTNMPSLRILVPLALAAVVAGGILLAGPRCERRGGGRAEPVPSPAPDSAGAAFTVMPLMAAAVDSAMASAPRGPELPVPAIILGGGSAPAGPDTLAARVAPLPDPAYEHIPPGVYYAAGDSLLEPLADALAVRAGLDSATAVDRVIVVRESDVPSFASWLRSLPPEIASSTAVIVETRSSVAGGAPWIRGYALYANGDRSRYQEPSCYLGEPAEGLPAQPGGGDCYRILIAPEL